MYQLYLLFASGIERVYIKYMAKKTTSDWHGCPIRYAAAIFGDEWSMLILRDLLFKGCKHYADFLGSEEGISTNILAARLVSLESEGMVHKEVDPEHGARFIYRPSEKCMELIPAMLEIIEWSEKWDRQTGVPDSFSIELKNDRAALASKIKAQLQSAEQ